MGSCLPCGALKAPPLLKAYTVKGITFGKKASHYVDAQSFEVFKANPCPGESAPPPKPKKPSTETTPDKMMGRWFTLLSGTLTVLAGDAIGNMSFLLGNGTDTVAEAANYTVIVLVFFVVLGAIFYNHKKSLDNAAKDEDKHGLLHLTPSEDLALTVNEGITNITNAMASILAQVWFQLLPAQSGVGFILGVFACGCVVLIIGEAIDRQLSKGGMPEYIVGLLNGMNVGSVSWWVGLAMANHTQELFGAPDNDFAKVTYWMWLVGLAFALAMMMLFHFISNRFFKKTDDKPYGHIVLSALKGIPMYSSGFILCNVIQHRWKGAYITGTLFWLTLSAVGLIIAENLVMQIPQGNGFTAKEVYMAGKQTVSILGHSLAFVVGQLAGFALYDVITLEYDTSWFMIGIRFQILAFAIEHARTADLLKLFKTCSCRKRGRCSMR